ncbi:hypothetical protein IFVP136_C1220207 [Vibrio parahaemolyticus]
MIKMDWSEISRFSSFIMDQNGPIETSVSKLTVQVNDAYMYESVLCELYYGLSLQSDSLS